MPKRFLVTSSPHYRSSESTRTIMIDVIVAMLPIIAVAVVFFGWRALSLILITVGACLSFETLYNAIAKKRNTVGDLSAVVTGIILAFNLPVTAPYWMAVIGAAFAIIIVKMLFGGLGKNFMNPALAARAFLFSWPSLMTTYVSPMLATPLPIFSDPIFTNGVTNDYIDSITTATPLGALKAGELPTQSLLDLFIGNKGGCLGEVCVAAILLGGFYLLFRKTITWHVPVFYIGTVALVTFVFPLTGGHFDVNYMLSHIFSGGLFLAAFFMATDYVTSPVTKRGKVIFAVGCGLLTVFLRYFSGYPEGVTFAVLIMNVLAVPIDKITKPRRYGIGGGYHVSASNK